MKNLYRKLCTGLFLGAFATFSQPLLADDHGDVIYEVSADDTLYGIAFRYGLNHHSIASWNRLRSPYTIYPGQRLRLTAPRRPVASAPKTQSSSSSFLVSKFRTIS